MFSSQNVIHWNETTIPQEATLRAAGAVFNGSSVEEMAITDASCHPVGVMTRGDFIRSCVQGLMDVPLAERMPDHAWTPVHGEISLERLVMLRAEYLFLVDAGGVCQGVVHKREIASQFLIRQDNPLLVFDNGCLLAIVDAAGETVFAGAGLGALHQVDSGRAFAGGSTLLQTVVETARGGHPLDGRELEWEGNSWMAFTVPIREGGTTLGAIGLFHHAQGVRSIINRLKRMEQLYSEVNTILETSYDGFTIIDGQGIITRVNKAHERITGSSPENMIGRHVLEAEKDGEFQNPVSMMVMKEKRTMTIRQKVKNGKFVTVTGNPVFDSDGQIRMVVCNVRDTSEIEAVKEKLLNTEMVYQVELEHMRRQQAHVDQLIVFSPLMRQVMETTGHIADKETSVLVLGDTGVGKEVLAKKIHQISSRRDGPYLKINCCAIHENLLESELFGYEGGSFTGARKGGKAGLLEAARGGTLFLDEIGDISMELQVKLLRVLQEKEIVRVGGVKAIRIDTRFIFATNRDLKAMVAEGRFRKDLYYRINVMPITIPALRHRKEDIKPFLEFFLKKFNQKHGYDKQFTPELIAALCNYSWPGNVRELENLVERLVVSVYSNIIDTVHFTEPGNTSQASQLSAQEAFLDPSMSSHLRLRAAVETMEKRLITQALLEHGSMGRAASVLGVDRTTILRKISKYGIQYQYQW